MGEETDGDLATGVEMQPMRYSDCTLEGETEKIESDVKLPATRVQSTPETGTQSNSGDFSTEWNIDEQDNLLAGVLCDSWATETPTTEETSAGVTSKKTIGMGETAKSYSFLKKYTQAPVEYQWFKNEHINTLKLAFEVSKFVKLTWGLMGANHPSKETTDPLTSKTPTYNNAMTTKSFKTLEGSIKIGDTSSALTENKQISNLEINVNNNIEKTDALFQTEAVEQSLGDFAITGTMDVLNSGTVAQTLYNDAVSGAEKYISVTVYRTVSGVKTSYTIALHVHLDKASESKDGNKLKNTIEWTMIGEDGITITKTVQTVS